MITPIRRQYLHLKKQYPDAILLFRLGDFYETFDEDAKIAARELDIVLTSRQVSSDQRVPLAGIPYHALENYLARLIQKGYKVAIAEQVSEVPIKGLMPREVIRVVTPGTVIEPGLLEARRNNYLAALIIGNGRAGIAYADITTGEFATTQLEGEALSVLVQQELQRLQPAELLVPDNRDIPSLEGIAVSSYEAWHWEQETARQTLKEHFEVASLAGFGCEGKPLAVQAAGALIQYLAETQKAALSQLQSLRTYSIEAFMILDAATRRNLELTETLRERKVKGSLLGVLDQTQTPMGGRLLRRWLSQPLLDIDSLNRRLDNVEALFNNTPVRLKVREGLRAVADLERLMSRVVQGVAGPRDLVSLRKSLEAVLPLKKVLAEWQGGTATTNRTDFLDAFSSLDACEDVVALIAQAITDDPPVALTGGGVIRAGFSAELDDIVTRSQQARQWVASLEQNERERTGIKSLKVGYNKVFGYYLEVTNPNLHLVPENYIRKQTLTNAERFITPELKEYEALILNAEERILELESQIFRQVREQVAAASRRVLATAATLAELDAYAALAEVAVNNRYVRPEVADDGRLDIIAGRHPVVELLQREEPFQPNDVHLSPEESIIILTGPNMSGKSTYLRQVALIVLMAQMGSFVPADRAHIGLVDRIFTRIGAQDEIAAGQSTFLVEMIETANILHHSTPRSLIILDEIGRGTSTYDGLAIARAVVEYLHNNPRLGARTLFATHYHELVELEHYLPRVRNYNVAVAEEGNRVVFLHKIVPGGADRSYGIHVAGLAGIPRAVINRAGEILAELENHEAWKEKRERARQQYQVQQLSLFHLEPHPVVEKLRNLRIEEMTPLEAINKLYELQQEAQG